MNLKRLLTIGLIALAGCTTNIPLSTIRVLSDKEGYDKVIAPYKHTVREIKYFSESPGHDFWQTPSETEAYGMGDCEDMAFYLQDKWKKEGLESQVMFGHLHWSPESIARNGHVWNEITWNGKTYLFDSSEKRMWSTNNPNYKKIYSMGATEKDIESFRRRLEEYTKRNGETLVNFHIGSR